MKKTFTFITLFVLSIAVNAQDAYRKSWDFTKWSSTTAANLKADTNWSDDEQGDNYAKKGPTTDKCWFLVTNTGSTVQANGADIAELTGLQSIITNERGLAIAVDFSTCVDRDGDGFGPYKGAQYLWLCSKDKPYFVIPHVEPGTTIKMGIESHKFTSARGVALYVGKDNKGTKLNDPVDDSGTVISGGKVTNYTDLIYTVPEDEQVTNEEDGTVDIAVYCGSDGGLHIYYIIVGDGDSKVEGPQPVGYLYSGDIDSDNVYTTLDGSSSFEMTAIDVANTTATADSLRKFKAVVIASSIAPTDPYVSTLKDVIAFVPTLNLNTAIYKTLGYGEAVESATGTLTVQTENETLFEGIDTTNGIELLPGGVITGVKLGDYFANDDIIATAGDVVAMHMHNANRNAYLLLPLSAEDLMNSDVDLVIQFLPQALQTVLETKKDVVAVGTPVITPEEKDGYTEVTITAANSKAIYYTTDGNDPTTSSTLYTGSFTLTAAATIKAFAVADGYIDSQIASKEVKIAVNAAAPEISLSREQGKTTITISSATEGAKLYFNFNEAKTPALSQEYKEPIVLTEPAMIYALAAADGYLNSDISSKYVGIDGIDAQTIRIDTLAHFDANQTDWFLNDEEAGGTGSASAYYFWGKSAWNYYSDEVDHEETVKGSDGQDSTVIVFKPNPDRLKIANPLNANGWVLKSEGQVLVGELTNGPLEGVGNGAAGRYADEAIDYIGTPTKGYISFKGKTSGEPWSARIESTDKYAGPFDVVVYAGNGNASGAGVLEIQTSKDGETWETFGTVKLASMQRYFKRTRVSVENTDEVYVRVAQVGGNSDAYIYDIILLNNGELSKAYTEEAAGIVNLQPAGEVVRTEIYSLNGTRVGNAGRGISIVRQTYADGSVVTKKVILK